jgi:hypothetical protein
LNSIHTSIRFHAFSLDLATKLSSVSVLWLKTAGDTRSTANSRFADVTATGVELLLALYAQVIAMNDNGSSAHEAASKSK